MKSPTAGIPGKLKGFSYKKELLVSKSLNRLLSPQEKKKITKSFMVSPKDVIEDFPDNIIGESPALKSFKPQQDPDTQTYNEEHN